MSIPPAWQELLYFCGRPIALEPSPGQLSSDAGLLPRRQFDEQIGLTRTFAEALAGINRSDSQFFHKTFPQTGYIARERSMADRMRVTSLIGHRRSGHDIR
jgi:hypothetical protein